MNSTKVSATYARNNFFEILDRVKEGMTLVIQKDKKAVAKLLPFRVEMGRNRGLMKALLKASRGFRYKDTENPLRRPGASNFLGKWDRKP